MTAGAIGAIPLRNFFRSIWAPFQQAPVTPHVPKLWHILKLVKLSSIMGLTVLTVGVAQLVERWIVVPVPPILPTHSHSFPELLF